MGARMERMRLGAARLMAWISRKTGFTADQLTAGLQVGLGALVMLAALSPPAVWTALSLQPAAITPVYALVTFCVVLQPNLGTASQFVLMRAAGAVVGGLAGLACMYLTLAANGGSYAPSLAKGAAMVSLLTALSFVLSLYRFRYPRYWFAFTVATFSAPMVALNPYHQPYVEHRALYYWWLQIALGVGTAALVSTFVFPMTAGRKVRLQTAEALRRLARLTSATVRHMVCLPLGKGGLAAGTSGTLDGQNAIDTGLGAAFLPLYEDANAVGALLTQTHALLGVVGTEWNPYSRAHFFPREAYEILMHINRAHLAALMALLYPLQSGRLALRAVHAMQADFQASADRLSDCLLAAADCVDRGAGYAAALAPLRRLEERWRTLGSLCPAINSSWGENEVLTCDMLVGTLFSLGARVRRLFFTLPEALHRSQPDARQACLKHFRGSQAWDLSQPQEQLRQRALLRCSTPTVAGLGLDLDAALPSPCAFLPSPRQPQSPYAQTPPPLDLEQQLQGDGRQQGFPGKQQPERAQSPQPAWRRLLPAWLAGEAHRQGSQPKPAAMEPLQEPPGWHQLPGSVSIPTGAAQASSEALWQLPDAATLAQRFPPVIRLPPRPPLGWLAGSVQAASRATGFSPQHAALAMQLAAAMAAACTLHVNAVTYAALQGKTIWAVVTVCVVLESAMGGLLLKSGLRVVGTAAAGLLGVGLLGLAVACNGGHYTNSPPKFVAMSAFLPAVLAALMACHVRHAQPYGYAWSVAKFTTPIIALSGYLAPSVQWVTACWRLANIMIGIGLDLAAATLILPVTSRRATEHRVQEVLAGLSDLAEAVLPHFAEGGEGWGREGTLPQADEASQQQHQQRRRPAATPGSRRSTSPTSGAGGAGQRSSGGQRLGGAPPTPLSSVEAAELAVAAAAGERSSRAAERLPRRGSTPSPIRAASLSASLDWERGTPPAGCVSAAQPAAARRRVGSVLCGLLTPGRGPAAATSSADPTVSGRAWQQRQRASAGSDQSAGCCEPGLAPPTLAAAIGGAAAAEEAEGPAPSPGPSPAASPRTGACGWQLAGTLGTPPSPNSQSPAPAAPRGAAQPQQRSHAAGWPAGPPPLSLSATNGGVRRTASLAPDLPTVESQQVLLAAGLPSLPPLHIPLHRRATLSEDEAQQAQQAAAAAAAGGGGGGTPPYCASATSRSDTPFGTAAAQRSGVAGQRAARGGSGEAGSPAALRRPSTSSTAFYQGTPRDPRQRRRRSTWLRQRALGRPFMAVHSLGGDLAAAIAHMGELALFARFEWVPWHRPHRMRPQDVLAARQACRKLLNVLVSVPHLLDAPDVPHRGPLLPHPREVRGVAEQLAEALRALGPVLQGQLPVESALAMLSNLRLQVQLLLLEVEAAGASPRATHTDAVLGVAALGTMFSATQTVQLLYRCVLRLLGTPRQHAAAEAALARGAAWGASVEAVLVARGVVVASLAAAGDGGQVEAEAEAAALRPGFGAGD